MTSDAMTAEERAGIERLIALSPINVDGFDTSNGLHGVLRDLHRELRRVEAEATSDAEAFGVLAEEVEAYRARARELELQNDELQQQVEAARTALEYVLPVFERMDEANRMATVRTVAVRRAYAVLAPQTGEVGS